MPFPGGRPGLRMAGVGAVYQMCVPDMWVESHVMQAGAMGGRLPRPQLSAVHTAYRGGGEHQRPVLARRHQLGTVGGQALGTELKRGLADGGSGRMASCLTVEQLAGRALELAGDADFPLARSMSSQLRPSA